MSSHLEEREALREGRRARRERRRQRRRRLTITVLVILALVVAVGSVVRYLINRPAPDPPVVATEPASPAVLAPPQDTLLLVRYDEAEQVAESITLLAQGSETSPPTILFIPVGTYVEIPGFGLERLSQAHQFGGAALVEASVENMMGITVDSTAAASTESLGVFLNRTGGLEVDVPERLVTRSDDGTAEVRFQPGLQFLDGERLAELWGFAGGDTELSTLGNQQLVWEALLQALRDEQVAEALVGDGAPQLATDASSEQVRDLLLSLSQASEEGELGFTILPVEPFGESDDQTTYRPKEDDVVDLVNARFPGSVPEGGGADSVEIQILNGVGTPGVGSAVDRALEGAGFRTVLTDNARSFDYDETLIVIYDEDAASVEAAERVRERLGVGTVQVSRQPQSLVDLTIVVGADFEYPDDGGADATEPSEQST